MADDTRDRTGALSDRQKDVLGKVAQGWTHAQIGRELGLNKRSVTNMVTRSIIPKLGVYRTVQAVVMHAQAEAFREAASTVEDGLILGPVGDAELHINDCMMRLIRQLRHRADEILP